MASRSARVRSARKRRHGKRNVARTSTTQLNIRISHEVRKALARAAGRVQLIPDLVRRIIDAHLREVREQELLAMFNRGARDLTEEDRQDRETWTRAYSNRE
jgi:hypothetical protein